jgi:hypothetical protein
MEPFGNLLLMLNMMSIWLITQKFFFNELILIDFSY